MDANPQDRFTEPTQYMKEEILICFQNFLSEIPKSIRSDLLTDCSLGHGGSHITKGIMRSKVLWLRSTVTKCLFPTQFLSTLFMNLNPGAPQ